MIEVGRLWRCLVLLEVTSISSVIKFKHVRSCPFAKVDCLGAEIGHSRQTDSQTNTMKIYIYIYSFNFCNIACVLSKINKFSTDIL